MRTCYVPNISAVSKIQLGIHYKHAHAHFGSVESAPAVPRRILCNLSNQELPTKIMTVYPKALYSPATLKLMANLKSQDPLLYA